MPRRAGDGLRQHSPVGGEDTRRQIAGLANRGGKGRAHDRLRLLLDDRDQPVPQHLKSHLFGNTCAGMCGITRSVAP